MIQSTQRQPSSHRADLFVLYARVMKRSRHFLTLPMIATLAAVTLSGCREERRELSSDWERFIDKERAEADHLVRDIEAFVRVNQIHTEKLKIFNQKIY